MDLFTDPSFGFDNIDSGVGLRRAVSADPDKWYSAIAEARIEYNNWAARIDELQEALSNTEHATELAMAGKDAQISLLTTQLESANTRQLTSSLGKSEKIADPPLFSGRNKTLLRPFLAQLYIKLHGNKDRYPSEQDKLIYTYGRLDGIAAQQILPYINNSGIDLANIQALVSKLESAFGDPDRQATSQQELQALQQRNSDFSIYLAEFRRLAIDTGYNDQALIAQLKAGLSREMKERMGHQIVRSDISYEDLIALMVQVDAAQRAYNSSVPSAAYTRRLATPSTPSSPLGSRSTSPSTLAQPSRTSSPFTLDRFSAPSSYTPSATPLDSSSATGLLYSRHRGPLSAAEKANRFRRGACLYCGVVGHFSSTCPNNKNPRPQSNLHEVSGPNSGPNHNHSYHDHTENEES